MAPGSLPTLLAAALALGTGVRGDEYDHRYVKNDDVYVYGNKIGPFNNPLETYGYFDIPWCKPEGELDVKKPTLGEALTGDELVRLQMQVGYRVNSAKRTVCTKTLTAAEAEELTAAVKQRYWYQLYIDDLPTWAALGRVTSSGAMIYTHQRFSLGYNEDSGTIVVANLTAENKVLLAPKAELVFTYSVEWTKSNIAFENRFRRYLDESFFEHKIHWVSVLNSFMMVFVLSCIVIIVLLRTLRADYARYAMEVEGGSSEFRDESGWKQVHGEVFRVPVNHVMLCALLGTGWQLLVLFFFLIFIAIASVIYTNRGGLLNYGVVAYAITSSVAGFASGRQFVKYAAVGPAISKDWKKTMFYTAALFPGLVAGTIFSLNFVAIIYSSQQAILGTTMLAVFLIWLLVNVPLVVLGTYVGRHTGKPDVPRVSQIPRRIPEKWKYYIPVGTALGGLIPFGSIFIELYFVFTSFWNYKFYYVYGFMLLVYIVLILVTMCMAVVFTYYLLNSEDYRWQWASFSLGFSTAGYVLLYATFFFFFKTKMTGFFMTVFYFGYMLLFCTALAILCGTVSFVSASIFVNRIYRNKLE